MSLCLFPFGLVVFLPCCPLLSHCLMSLCQVVPLSDNRYPFVTLSCCQCPTVPLSIVPLSRCPFSAVPLACCPVVPLSCCPTLPLSVVQLSRCPLFLWPVVPLARCSFGPLSRFSVVLLSHCHLVLVSVGLFDVAPWWQILWPTDKPLSNEQNWDKFTTKEKFPKEKQFVFAKLKLLILPFFLFLETFHSLDIVIFCYKCSRHAVHLFLWLFSGWCSPWH